MQQRIVYVILAAAVFVVCSAETVQGKDLQVRDVIKETFDVRPGGTLHIDLDHGNIEVATSPGNRVLIEMERIARADDREIADRMLEQHEYAFDKRSNDVHIRSRYDEDQTFMRRWRNRAKLKIHLTVLVPEEYNVDFSSGAGNIEISDLRGRIEGRTGAGTIEISDIAGEIEVTSGAGDIEVDGDAERVKVTTGAGDIDLYGLTGAVEASTGAGNIYAEITRQPRRPSELSSGAGDVTVRLSRDVGVYVDATASLGSAECEYSLKVEGKWLKKSFAGEVNGGGPELRMRSGVGNVALKRN